MRFSELDGGTIGVWGAGAETRSFARHAAEKLPRTRISVVVLEQEADAPELTADATVVGADDAVDALAGCDVLVRSPGVSLHRPELRALIQRGLPTATPTGLWLAEHGAARVIGITGTKGKSTTAKLTAHVVRASGAAVQLAGNIGHPALDLLDSHAGELVVLELSSYQIADLAQGSEVAVALNLYREHLNWHLTDDAYRQDKLRLLSLPGVRRCVVNALSPTVMAVPRASGATTHAFGTADGWHVDDAGGVRRAERLVLAERDLPLPGPHNALNLCAALTALETAGVPLPPLGEALASFEPLAHRLQIVLETDGVAWVDDSISTTPESAIAAIESFPARSVVLIGGGEDRGQAHGALAAMLAARGATVLGIAKHDSTGPRLVAAARAAGVPEERARVVADLPEAVAAAQAVAGPGAVVLLSPAAPSYNTHADYIARGHDFLALARAAIGRS